MIAKNCAKAGVSGLFVVLLLAGISQTARADYSQGEEVRATLAALNQWLGKTDNGQKWNAYLKTDALRAELDKGQDADPKVLADAIAQYESKAAGLDRAKFAAVRDALAAWIDELSLPGPDELPELAKTSKENYLPVSDEALAARKREFASAAARLGRYLDRAGENGRRWKTYLEWEKLDEQLADGAKPNVAALAGVYRRLTSDHAGLELPVYAGVASALRQYIDAAAVAQMPNAREQYEKELDALAETLSRYAERGGEEDNFAIGQRLGWFAGTDQSPMLVAVRAHHSHPNLFVSLSRRLVAVGLERPVDMKIDVRDNILGTDIHGNGHTTGKLVLELVPYRSRASFAMMLVAETATKTVGYNGPVSIHADGVTRFGATKQIFLDAEGFHSAPTRSVAVTRTNVNGLGTRGGLLDGMVRNIAWDRIGQSKSLGERIAADHAAQRVNRQMDDESNEMLRDSNRKYQEEFRLPLVRRGEFLEKLRFHTTKDRLYVTGLKANRFQLGAPAAPPASGEQSDLEVRVHELMANNFTAAILAGETLTDDDMRKQIEKMNDGVLPDKYKEQEDEEPWSITFTRQRPVTVLFTDGGLEVTIRGRRYTSGDRMFDAMNVSARYAVEKTPQGIKLVRQGELTIVPPGFDADTTRLSAQQVALKTILQRKFGKMFEPEIQGEGLKLPGRWEEAGKLVLDELATGNGWMTIGWRLPDQVASQSAVEKEGTVK